MTLTRRRVPSEQRRQVLIEAGFRCAVPTCRTILTLDLHHIVAVSKGGGNEPSNLLVLCPTCHALYERGEIPPQAIYSWKAMLVALNRAFDPEALDNLLFLRSLAPRQLLVSGDGVLKFSRLVATGLASFALVMQNGPLVRYDVQLTEKGRLLVDAWRSGDQTALRDALNFRQDGR